MTYTCHEQSESLRQLCPFRTERGQHWIQQRSRMRLFDYAVDEKNAYKADGRDDAEKG